jgi:hypothetical protein
MEVAPICINCKNYKKFGTCKAFKNIPPEIWSAGKEHNEPTKDQENKIVFEPLENA